MAHHVRLSLRSSKRFFFVTPPVRGVAVPSRGAAAEVQRRPYGLRLGDQIQIPISGS